MPVPDDFPQLAPHHFDGLRESVRALNGTIAKAEEQRARDSRETLAALQRLTTACEQVSANLSALNDIKIPAQTNGNGNSHHEETRDDRSSDDA